MTDFVRRIAFGKLEPFEVLDYIKKSMPKREIPEFAEKLKAISIVELMPSMADYRTLTRAQAERLIAIADYIESNLSRLQATPEPSTERAKKAFDLAIYADFMEKTDSGYKWKYNRGSHVSLAYFLVLVYDPARKKDPGGKGENIVPYTDLNELFGRKRLDSYADKAFNVAKPQKWRKKIDILLEEL